MARLEQLLEQIRKDRDVRRNLIEIRQNITDESLRRRFMYQLGGDFSLFTDLLRHEDPKVRRNAALILSATEDEDVLPALMEAWEKEETLYIREDYLKAISALDYRACLPRLKQRIQELSDLMGAMTEAPEEEGEETAGDSAGEENAERETRMPSQDYAEGEPQKPSQDCAEREPQNPSQDSAEHPLWDNDRHLLAELSRLRQMVEHYERHGRHHFIKMNPAPELFLRTNVLHTDVTAGQIRTGAVRTVRGGIHVKGGNLDEIMKVRTWIECLFPIPGTRPIIGDPKMIASKLRDLKIGNYLSYLHEDNGQPYRYRIELKSPTVPDEKKGEYIRRIASRLDVLEKGKLLNSNSDYEVELRLIERKDRSLIPMLKLFTLPDQRFAYRRETISQSTSAPLAALSAALAAPYLKEGAQILDSFCGVGTLLIERCLLVPADSVYGVDRFAEAVEKARVNSEPAKNVRHAPIHYINRDFFDFTHDYPFDEIITHFPESAAGEAELFAGRFLDRAGTLLADHAVLIILTDQPGELKTAASERTGYSVGDSYLLNERSGCTEVILKFERA